MPLPLVAAVPAALVVAAAGARAYRRARAHGIRSQATEDALDALPEGVSCHSDDDSRSATLRWCRTFQWRGGARYELDLAALGRIRLKRL